MAKGVDRLIDWCISEISFADDEGYSPREFIHAVKRYFDDDDGNGGVGLEEPGLDIDSSDFRVAARAWDAVVARAEIFAGDNRRDRSWNHMSLKEICQLPSGDSERENDESNVRSSGPAQSQSPSQSASASRRVVEPTRSLPAKQPRIYTSEETTWMNITGHGVDFSRIPMCQWRLLVKLAPLKSRGVLQGDMSRLANQTKSSVPKRTDRLAQNGYIAKRTIVVRGCKTSKLWLARFAPPELPTADRSLALQQDVDMSPTALTKDLRPVSWCSRWTGTTIDHDALGRTLICLVKAWEVMRIADLKNKLGIHGMRWQMKVLARTCRRFAAAGVVKYVAASLGSTGRVFRDCIKFVRDPTEDEWASYLSTGGAKRKVTSLTAAAAAPKRHISPLLSAWVPEKPLVNTVFETVKRAGTLGVSGPQVRDLTVGYPFRRYMDSSMKNLSTLGAQPPHLGHLQVKGERLGSGRSMAHVFTVSNPDESAPGSTPSQEATEAMEIDSTNQQHGTGENDIPAAQVAFEFGPIPTALSKIKATATLSSLGKVNERPGPKSRPYKSRLSLLAGTAPAEATRTPEGQSPTKRARTTATPQAERNVGFEVTMLDTPVQPPAQDPTATNQRGGGRQGEPTKDSSAAGTRIERPPERPPGVYFGEPNSLGTVKRGRRPKSLVLIVKLENLKDPEFLKSGFGARKRKARTTQSIGSHTILEARYNGHAGKLGLSTSSGEITFDYSPAVNGKDPLRVPLDDILESPTLELSPDEGGRALIINVTRNNSRWPYLFLFDNSAEASETASSFRQEVEALKARISHPDLEPSNRAPTPTPTPVEEEIPATTRNGRKRKGGKKAGGEGYKCDKCGNTWKNDIGLKYHLKKSKTSCNPDYVPETIEERVRKRRRVTYVDDKTEPQAEETLGRPPKRRATRTQSRGDVETQSPRRMPFVFGRKVTKGLISLSATPRGIKLDMAPVSTIPRQTQKKASPGEPMATPDVLDANKAEPPRLSGRPHLLPPSCGAIGPSHRNVEEPKATGRDVEDKNKAKANSKFPSKPHMLQGLQPASDTRLELFPEPRSASAPEKDKGPIDGERPPPATSNTELDQPDQPDQLDDTEEAVPKFILQPPPEKLGKLLVSTHRTMEVIKYLVDHNGGVFPGDKALWIAVVALYKKEIPDQRPPSLRSCAAVLKTMERKHLIRPHTYVWRNSKGSFTNLTLIIKNGFPETDPLVAQVKEKVQAAHPEPYVPEVFALPPEILRQLDSLLMDELKSMNGRSKRKVATEVEVLKAPFYEEAQTVRLVRQEMADNDSDLDGLTQYGVPAGERSLAAGGLLENWTEDPSLETSHGGRDFSAVLMSRLIGRMPAKLGRKPLHPENGRLRRRRGGGPYFPRGSGRGSPNPGLHSLPYSFFHGPLIRYQPEMPSDVQFLLPITSFPEECSTDEEAETETDTDAEDGEAEMMHDSQGKQRDVDKDCQFTDTFVLGDLPGPSGTWPSLTKGFFRRHEGSFTVEGRTPSAGMILSQHVPQSVADMISMCSSSDRLANCSDPHYAQFCWDVDACAAWEISSSYLLSSSSLAPEYRFFNLRANKSLFGTDETRFFRRENIWLDGYQFTVNTLPYNALAGGDYDARRLNPDPRFMPYHILPRGRGRGGYRGGRGGMSRGGVGRGRGGGRGGGYGTRGRFPADRVVVYKKTRELTAYPRTPDQFFRNSKDKKTAAGVAEDDIDWSGHETRIAAFVAVRTLTGGVDKTVDYGILMRIFPDMKLSALRKFWTLMRKTRGFYIDIATEAFQEAFIDAYEKGEVPALDYDDLLTFDWRMLVRWTVDLLLNGGVRLPATEQDVEREFLLNEAAYQKPEWRDNYFHFQRSVWNRFQDACSEPAAIPLEGGAMCVDGRRRRQQPEQQLLLQGQPLSVDDHERIAASWIRALCSTSPEKYTKQMIAARVEALGYSGDKEMEAFLTPLVYRLQNYRVICKSTASPLRSGRKYRFTKYFLVALDKLSQLDKFSQALRTKRRLDDMFRRGGEAAAFELTYTADDGTIMAVMNMQAHGRVAVEAVDTPQIPFGFEPGNYETRKYSKEWYHFGIRVRPTGRYVYSEDVAALGSVRGPSAAPSCMEAAEAPAAGVDNRWPGEVPAWCDFLGALMPERWGKLVAAVFFVLATRGSMDAEQITRATKPLTTVFDSRGIVDWGLSLGLLEKSVWGEGVCVTEWWWLAVGELLERMVGGDGVGVGVGVSGTEIEARTTMTAPAEYSGAEVVEA